MSSIKVNSGDVVPKVPGSLVSLMDDETDEQLDDPTLYNVLHTLLHAAHPAYVHVGIALHLDNSHSPFLKTSAKLADLHKTLTSIYILWMGIVAQTNHSLVRALLTTNWLVRSQLASIPFPRAFCNST